ncbi:uncharacterized protein TNCV_2830591 [Trichonephila clavipes]|nr:uncharacterized protein TNCV_2830591 [Trichonephila clavipes]
MRQAVVQNGWLQHRTPAYQRQDFRLQHTRQDALFIYYKQYPDNEHSVAFSQLSSSPHLIENETFNDSDIINNLIDYEDGQEGPDSLRVDKNMQGSTFPTNW